MKQYRQGDVFIYTSAIPKDAKPITEKKIVLALGEATGHHHRVMVVVQT